MTDLESLDIEYLDFSAEILAELTKDELIELIQKLKNKMDELEGIRKNEQGEEIVGEDEVIQDGEVVVL